MSSFIMLLLAGAIFLIATPSTAYVDLGYATMPFEPQFDPVPRPHQLPEDIYLRFDSRPSMITAIAPLVTLAANGSYSTMYSVHYHDYFSRRRVGKGVFKRGVFANDPPIATCTPCGGSNITGTGAPTSTSSLSCTTHTYTGVFRFPDTSSVSTSYCYDSNYGGVFKPSTTSSTGLPCCFTIPASCLANSSSITYTYTSGVFRSSSTMSYYSNITTSSSSSTMSTTASPSSPQSLTTPSSTMFTSSISSTSSSTSTISSSRPVTSIGTAVPGSPDQTATSSSSTSSPTSSAMYTSSYINYGTSLSSSVIQSSGASMIPASSPSNGPGPGSTSASTLTVITAVPTTPSPSPVTVVTTANNTIEGCGTASGSGVVDGIGTVYIGPGGLIPVASSGIVSGYAATVVGCGTLTATTGSFRGSATIVACGFGSGTATMTGTGTVWPAIGGGLISFISSGILTGSGSVRGCGTLTGSGTFSATGPYIKTITSTPSASPVQTTVEVYLSYCPTDATAQGLPRLGSNFTAPPYQFNNASILGYDYSANGTIDGMMFCHPCPKQAGICCPPGVACEDDGTCPWEAIVNAGYVLEGYNLVDIRNSTAPVPKRRTRDTHAGLNGRG